MIEIKNINTKDLSSIGLSQTSKGILLKWNYKEFYYKSGSLRYGLFDNGLSLYSDLDSTEIKNINKNQYIKKDTINQNHLPKNITHK